MSSRLDAALRKLVEAGIPLENMNPEVLSRDYGDPRFSRRPMKPESRPFMGDWVPALADKIGSGIGGAARWVDENVPSMGGPVDAELLASLIQPLRGSDLGATGTHAGDVYPGVPKAAGMVIGPAAAFAPKGYRAIKRLFGGADEAVDQLKLPGTARTRAPKTSTTPKVRIDAIEEALQADLPLSLYYKNLAEVSGYTDNIAVNQPERYSYIFDETMDSMRPYHQPAMKTKEQFYKFLDFKVTNSKMDEIHDVFREIRDYAQRTLMGEPTDLESFLPNTKWKGKPVERSVEPSATPTPKKEQKKKLTPKEIRAKKDKETIKKEQEAVRSNKLFSDSLNHDLEIRELSRTQYDELIDGGWKHQDIMNEHPVIPSSVRREGREWLELDSSPTPKTKRKPFDEYTRDRSPESYINPGDTELQKEFAEIASAQRGAPEKIMLKITSIDKGMGEKEYTFISEHIGDLYNRMTQPGNMDYSFGTITDKFKKIKLNLSPKSNATLPKYVKRIKEEMPEVVELLDEFADAHAAVDISTSMGVAKPVQLARDAAVAYGKLDLDEAVRLLKELEPYMENYDLFKKAMFNFGL